MTKDEMITKASELSKSLNVLIQNRAKYSVLQDALKLDLFNVLGKLEMMSVLLKAGVPMGDIEKLFYRALEEVYDFHIAIIDAQSFGVMPALYTGYFRYPTWINEVLREYRIDHVEDYLQLLYEE